MTRLVAFLKTLGPFAVGFLGATLLCALVGSGYWVYLRYSEFTVIRQVVGQIIENSNKEQAKREAMKKPEKVEP